MQVKTQPFVSVLILNYNGEDYLANCIQSVLKSPYPNFEVLLVDNASTDDSLNNAQQAFGADPRLRIVKNHANLGFSGGNNAGLPHCRGEYIVFLNNDTAVEPEWLSALVEAMQSDPTIGLAQSLILMMDSERIQIGGWLFSNYLVRKQALGNIMHSKTQFTSVFEVSVASGACMIVKRALLDEIGLFDSTIPFFYDDTLLSLKVWLAGKRVVTVPNSRIRHILGATSSWNVESTTFNLLRAKICLIFDVYYRLDELARAALVNFLNTLMNSLFAIKWGQIPVISANIHGLAWGLSNLKYLWRNRRIRWSKSKISHDQLKRNFIRVNVPVPLYLVPSKLSEDYFILEVNKLEKAVIQAQFPRVIS